MSNGTETAVWEKRFTFVGGKPRIDCGGQSYCVNHIIAGILGEVGKDRIFADRPLLTEADYEAVLSYLPEYNKRAAIADLEWRLGRAKERARAALGVAREAVEQLEVVLDHLQAIEPRGIGELWDMEILGLTIGVAINAKADDIGITRLKDALGGMASDLAEAKSQHAYLVAGDFSE